MTSDLVWPMLLSVNSVVQGQDARLKLLNIKCLVAMSR